MNLKTLTLKNNSKKPNMMKNIKKWLIALICISSTFIASACHFIPFDINSSAKESSQSSMELSSEESSDSLEESSSEEVSSDVESYEMSSESLEDSSESDSLEESSESVEESSSVESSQSSDGTIELPEDKFD